MANFVGVFKGLYIRDFDPNHTALLISLGQCTGWSAEHIASVFNPICHVPFSAPDIWSMFYAWFLNRKGKKFSGSDISTMLHVIQEANVEFSGNVDGSSLNETPCPRTIKFTANWCPEVPTLDALLMRELADPVQKDGDDRLCEGYDDELRYAARTHLYLCRRDLRSFIKPTPQEQTVTVKFGSAMENIINNTLKAWGVALLEMLTNDRQPHRIFGPGESKAYVNLAVRHLGKYVHAFEQVFGIMAESTSAENLSQDGVVIRSTAFGVKVLLGLMMADRLRVVSRVRYEFAQTLTFLPISVHHLPQDRTECSICSNEFEVPNSEGTIEVALRLRVCCGQVIGDSCLKEHLQTVYKGVLKTECPFCRLLFPRTIIEGLFGAQAYDPFAIIAAAKMAALADGHYSTDSEDSNEEEESYFEDEDEVEFDLEEFEPVGDHSRDDLADVILPDSLVPVHEADVISIVDEDIDAVVLLPPGGLDKDNESVDQIIVET